jgi:outer membrane protein
VRRPNLLLISAVLLTMAAPSFAGRIGFVDAERAVVSVEEGKVKMRELEAWAGPERERVEGLAAKASEARNQLAAQARVASAETLSALQEEERRATRAFEDARRDFERQLEKKQNEFLAEVAVKVGQVSSDYAKANDFDAILVLNAQPLVYISPEIELTDTIIRLYNERFPVN